MESSEKIWKDSLKKSYSNALTTATQGSTGEILSDMNKYSKEMREEKDSDKPVENKITKSDVSKVTAKQQFARDLQDDPDFQDFKKNAKYEKGGSTFTFGVPNVSTEDPYIKKRTKYGRPGRGKEETKEATGSGSVGSYVGQVAFADSDFMRNSFKETPSLKEGEKLKGGKADNKTLRDIAKKHTPSKGDIDMMEKQLQSQLQQGMKVEMEHTKDKDKAREIVMDHLFEDPKYYSKLKKVESGESTSRLSKKSEKIKEGLEVGSMVENPGETTEATSSASVGGYSSPSMWAKSTSKKDWGPSRKTQYKGGSFVKVKKKCTRFPYCNQGDINALKLTKTESVKEAIKKVSQKLNISEEIIETIIQKEYIKTSKRHK